MKCTQRQTQAMTICWIIITSVSSTQGFDLISELYTRNGDKNYNTQIETKGNLRSGVSVIPRVHKREENIFYRDYRKLHQSGNRNQESNYNLPRNKRRNIYTSNYRQEHNVIKHKRHAQKKHRRKRKRKHNLKPKAMKRNGVLFPHNFQILEKRDNSKGTLPDCELTQLMTYLARLQIINPESIIKLASEQDVNGVCNMLENSLTDIDKYLATCKPPQQKDLYMQLINGVHTLNNKLCKDEKFKKEFMKHSNCFPKLGEKYEKCVGPSDWLEYPSPAEICKTFDEIADCYSKKTQETCGHDGAEMMKALIKEIINSVITVDCGHTATAGSADSSEPANVAGDTAAPQAEVQTAATERESAQGAKVVGEADVRTPSAEDADDGPGGASVGGDRKIIVHNDAMRVTVLYVLCIILNLISVFFFATPTLLFV